MKTIDVTEYSAAWILRAMVAMRRDGEVQIEYGQWAQRCKWAGDGNDETRLVQAVAKLKEHGK